MQATPPASDAGGVLTIADDLMRVFVTGGTGYLGASAIAALLARGHEVHALVRGGSQHKLPSGAIATIGDALDAATFMHVVHRGDTLLHLVGTPKPSPWKAKEFERVDLGSIQQSTHVAQKRAVAHVVHLSVAHPAPIMRAYLAVRTRGEALLAESGVPFTALRPWYVLGPGHYWPYALVPLYAICRALPFSRNAAARLGLVTHRQMIAAIVNAIEVAPFAGARIVEAPAIATSRLTRQPPTTSST